MTIKSNIVYRGDCIFMNDEDIFPDESVDLIYLDPPFSSNRIYGSTYKKDSSGVAPSFNDMWKGKLEGYVAYMKPRLIQMHRVLKDTGSIYYHCDHHANRHVWRLMDEIFGANNFQNDIIWCYTGASNTKKWFARKHDTILFYTKSKLHTFNVQYEAYKKSNKCAGKTSFSSLDEDDRQKRLDKLDKRGKPIEDYWNIPIINSCAKERVGYPTQKPVELLKRIILASSNQGDVVLDPFCGSGSTLVTCQSSFDDTGIMNRKFIGIDVSPIACDIAVNRLREEGVEISPTDILNLIGGNVPSTIGDEHRDMQYMKWLAQDDPYYFQDVCCGKLGAIGNSKKSGDHGIDGTDKDGNPVQVKGSPNVGEPKIRDFLGAVISKGKSIGKFVAFSFSPSSYEFVAKCKRERDIDIQLICVKDLPTIELASNQKSIASFKVDKSSPQVRAPPIIQPTLFDY
jgi:DNA modification methylase